MTIDGRNALSLISAIALCASAADKAFGQQEYPVKPIRIVTTPAGGGSDLVSRVIAQGITGRLGQPVVIDNRASSVMAETVARAPADGYTLLIAGSTVWIAPLLLATNYDPVKDLAPIVMTDRAPLFLVVHPSLPVKSVKELIAVAKSRPGQLNYPTGGIGGSMHLSMELFKYMAGVNIISISYKGGAQALSDLVAGQVQVAMSNSATLPGYVKAGRLRAVAVTSAEPTALYPGVPTVASTGLPGYESVGTGAVFAPAKTPEGIIKRLNQEIARVLEQTDVQEKFLNSGTEAATSHSPEKLAATIKGDIARFGKMIKDVGIKID